MNMKKYFIISMLAVLGLASCNSMLELNPHSAVSPGSVGIKDIDALRSGMYYNVQECPGPESYIMFDLFGGELTTKQSTNSLDLINSLSSANNALMEEAWQGCYKALMQVNNVYDIAQDLPEGTEKDRILGECHYFRAYLHLCLVTRHGDVPLMKENTDDKVSRTPAAEVWNFIDGELEQAVALLGNPESQNYLSNDAAKALKARVSLIWVIRKRRPHFQKASSLMQNMDLLHLKRSSVRETTMKLYSHSHALQATSLTLQ